MFSGIKSQPCSKALLPIIRKLPSSDLAFLNSDPLLDTASGCSTADFILPISTATGGERRLLNRPLTTVAVLTRRRNPGAADLQQFALE